MAALHPQNGDKISFELRTWEINKDATPAYAIFDSERKDVTFHEKIGM